MKVLLVGYVYPAQKQESSEISCHRVVEAGKVTIGIREMKLNLLGRQLLFRVSIRKQVKITSLFTYWSKHVWDSVKFYKENISRMPR